MFCWVRSVKDVVEVCNFFCNWCDHVCVMLFLDGILCSIHGWNFPDIMIVFRFCEMLVYCDVHLVNLYYVGVVINWVPMFFVWDQMCDVAFRVGVHLDKMVGYRGSFIVDGVVIVDGFLLTELNL